MDYNEIIAQKLEKIGESVFFVVVQRTRIIESIHSQVTDCGLVVWLYKPKLQDLHQLCAYATVCKLYINAKSANQHSRVSAHPLFLGYFLQKLLFLRIRQQVNADSIV